VTKYMLGGEADRVAAAERARAIASYFADSEHHKSHIKAIDRDQARAQGVVIDNLEADQALQDAVLSVHHAVMITLQGTAVKVIENQLGHTFVSHQFAQLVQTPAQAFPQAIPQRPAFPLP